MRQLLLFVLAPLLLGLSAYANQTQNDWWRETVIYQIYPRSFQDSNGDGIGDIRGIINRLDYLNDLGITTIWLSPIYPSPQVDFGYDIANYKNIDPAYGTLDDFRELIHECNKRGIKLMMDMVLNHTSIKHPWFLESRSSKDNPKRNWYIWKYSKQGGVPNNWRSPMAGETAWEWDKKTKQYYYHSFLKEQADLNWRNPEVWAAFKDILEFWLKLGVAGFRLDTINFVMKDSLFRDNPSWNPFDWKWPHAFVVGYFRQKHMYDKNQPETMPLLNWLRSIVAPYNAVLLGEVMTEDNNHFASHYYGKNPGQGLQLVFNLDMVFEVSSWDARKFKELFVNWIDRLPAHAQPVYTLSNHDWIRHITKFGDNLDKAKLMAMLMLTLKGTPVIYYGEEIGMPNSNFESHEILDPAGHQLKNLAFGIPAWLGVANQLGLMGRDGCRTPMQWDNSPNWGFSKVKGWLSSKHHIRGRTVAEQNIDPNSLLSLYRHLIGLRNSSQPLRSGTQKKLASCEKNPNLICYQRNASKEVLTVILNLSDTSQTIDTNGVAQAHCLLSTYSTCQLSTNTSKMTLRSLEGIVWRN